MKIGIDLDDVLSQSTPALIKFHNNTYGTTFKIEDLKSYKLLTILGGEKESAERKIHEFHTSTYGKNAKPVVGAKALLNKLRKNNELYVITARGDDIKKETNSWIETNFPNTFSKIYLTNEFLKHNSQINKKTVCDDLDIDIFIEDNLSYALECVGQKRKVYLLDYPWNQTDKLPKGMTRVYSWREIYQLIAENI